MPPGQPSYEINDYVEDHYDRDVTEAITVAVGGRASLAGQLDALHDRIEAHRRHQARAASSTRPRDTVAYANFARRGEGAHRRARRTRCARSAPSGAPGAAELLVSGNTARFIDQKQSLIDHTPLVIAIVVVTHPRSCSSC